MGMSNRIMGMRSYDPVVEDAEVGFDLNTFLELGVVIDKFQQ